jgi:hypothetical protein
LSTGRVRDRPTRAADHLTKAFDFVAAQKPCSSTRAWAAASENPIRVISQRMTALFMMANKRDGLYQRKEKRVRTIDFRSNRM